MPTFVPLGGDLAGNLVAGLVANNIVDVFEVADANSQTGKLLRYLIGPAFDEFKSLADMNAVAASETAMNVVVASETARNAIRNSSTAWNSVAASNIAIGKFVAWEAGLNPADYADMNAVAASATAMNVVAASATAMNAVVASATAMNAVVASATAMNAVAASATAMNIALKSSIARNAMAASATARSAIISNLSTLDDTTKFSKTTTYVEYAGNGTDTYTAPANSLLHITQFYAYNKQSTVQGGDGTVIITAVNGNYQIMNSANISVHYNNTSTVNLNDISIGNFTVYRNLVGPNPQQVGHKVSFTIYTAI